MRVQQKTAGLKLKAGSSGRAGAKGSAAVATTVLQEVQPSTFTYFTGAVLRNIVFDNVDTETALLWIYFALAAASHQCWQAAALLVGRVWTEEMQWNMFAVFDRHTNDIFFVICLGFAVVCTAFSKWFLRNCVWLPVLAGSYFVSYMLYIVDVVVLKLCSL